MFNSRSGCGEEVGVSLQWTIHEDCFIKCVGDAGDKHLQFAFFSRYLKYFPLVLVTQSILCTYVFLNLM